MGDSRAAPGFGVLDLDLEAESGRGFGDPDIDAGLPNSDRAPASSQRPHSPAQREPGTRITRRADPDAAALAEEPAPASVHDEHTRIVSAGESLSAVARRDSEQPPSMRSAPSGSGVATRDDRVAAMRELYAKGDAAGALLLASETEETPQAPPRESFDYPDASVVVTFGPEEEITDSAGLLIPIDVDDVLVERERTLAVNVSARAAARDMLEASRPAPSTPPAAPPPAVAALTLTERQSIPRVLKSMAEVAKLPIDHRAGFLLSHFDGIQTLEEILDVCAMPTDEALALITSLKEMGVIALE